MAIDCSSVLNGMVGADCSVGAVAGTGGDVVLIPVKGFTVSTASDLGGGSMELSDGIGTLEGGKAAKIQTFPDAVIGSYEAVVGTYTTKFKHNVEVKIFLRSDEVKMGLNAIRTGRYAVIVPLGSGDMSNKTDVIVAELYGATNGLVASAISGTTALEDGVAVNVTLSSKDGAEENLVPINLVGTFAELEVQIKSLTEPKPLG